MLYEAAKSRRNFESFQAKRRSKTYQQPEDFDQTSKEQTTNQPVSNDTTTINNNVDVNACFAAAL